MKTIVSLALAGLMSISALLPALAAQEAESVSIAESSGISESMAQDESYCLLWEVMNAEFEQLGAQGCTAANCVFTDGMIILMR